MEEIKKVSRLYYVVKYKYKEKVIHYMDKSHHYNFKNLKLVVQVMQLQINYTYLKQVLKN